MRAIDRKVWRRRNWRRERDTSRNVTKLPVTLQNACKHFRAQLFLLINIEQCWERNNTGVKQQSAIKSGYRKCYRTSWIVFCGGQKYWIFYNAIKRSQYDGVAGDGGEVIMELAVLSVCNHDFGPRPDRFRSDKSFSRTEKKNNGLGSTVAPPSSLPFTVALSFTNDEKPFSLSLSLSLSLSPYSFSPSPSTQRESKSRSALAAQNGFFLFRNYRDVGSLSRGGRTRRERREKENKGRRGERKGERKRKRERDKPEACNGNDGGGGRCRPKV